MRQLFNYIWPVGLGGLLAVLLLVEDGEAQYGLYEAPKDLSAVETGWTPHSPFLLRPNTLMEYSNFGWRRYRERGSGFDWFPTYDQLGEPWLAGSATVFSWVEDRTRAPDFSSNFSKNLGRHNNIAIAREDFTNGAVRLMVGEAVRTTFTSLTLDMSRFTGIRGDAILGQNHELVILASRASDPIHRVRLNTIGNNTRDHGTLLGGGHWQGRFLQGAMHIGATFVNHHRFDSLQDDGNFLKGTMPREMAPDSVMVRYVDDSPRGGSQGAAVYGGQVRMTLVRASGENRVVQGIQPVVVASQGVRREDDRWLVEDGAFLEHVVPVPNTAVGLETTAEVGQDYRIADRQVHRAVERVTVKEEIRRTPLVTRQRADGQGGDKVETIALDYGLPSAQNISGLNGKLALGKFNFDWEFARSTVHVQFPEEQVGTRDSYSGNAYFARGNRSWGWLDLGGEYFSISPKYSSYALDDGNYRLGDHIQPGRVDVIAGDFTGNNLQFYFNESQPNVFRSGNEKRYMLFPLVEDNDDDDQFRDQGQNDEPVIVRTQPNESGVYPGWDLDKDGVPDYNRNRNNIPDFAEPFFKYWQEEQVFYWGDDYNHNGVLDYFEDDSLPDYPYYKDEKGHHLFVDLATPVKGLRFKVGRIRVEQIAGPGENRDDYVSLLYRRVFPGRARLQWTHEFKQVEDDIANNTFQYLLQEDEVDVEGSYTSVFVEDALNMRNSTVNRGYVGTQWSPLRGLNLHNNLRYELNSQKADQFADGVVQEDGDFNTWAMVNKFDYTWRWKRLTLQPMFKHTLLKQDLLAGTAPGGIPSSTDVVDGIFSSRARDVTELVPIFHAGIDFTELTRLEVGIEGFPFFKERFIDRENSLADFDSETYLAQIKMRGVSGGFDVFIVTGMQYTKKEFDEAALPSGSFVRSFFQIFVGEQILAAAQ
ncbi:MAG: hypothetical protein GKR89_10255 [Candidatus Latescibacteria bacterium]|nr:hypothetical protein [Candidatus Latescibacterota bacterium]